MKEYLLDEDLDVTYPINVCLYRDSNPYEDAYYDACIYEDGIDVDEETLEHASGDRYGLRHKVEGFDFKTFKKVIGADGKELAGVVFREFSGEGGVRRFRDFCETHGIRTTLYLLR